MKNWENYNLKDIEGEEWKPVPNWPNYFASNKCRIKFFSKKYKNGRLLRQNKRRGYLSVTLIRDDKTTLHTKAHRVIAFAWVDNPDNKPCVNHDDFDRENNEPYNLIWATHQENTDHMKLHNRTLKGCDNPASILTEKQAAKIKIDRSKVKDIALKYGVSIPTIEAIRYGRTWKHITPTKQYQI